MKMTKWVYLKVIWLYNSLSSKAMFSQNTNSGIFVNTNICIQVKIYTSLWVFEKKKHKYFKYASTHFC